MKDNEIPIWFVDKLVGRKPEGLLPWESILRYRIEGKSLIPIGCDGKPIRDLRLEFTITYFFLDNNYDELIKKLETHD